MKRLRQAPTLPDAHMLRGVLQRAGIEALVFNDNAQGGVGQLPVADAMPEVWVVQERDYERTCGVLEEFERTPRDTGTRHCPACGEDNPGHFQVCWKCEAGL